MKKFIQQFNGIKLSPQQMKNIKGGGTFCEGVCAGGGTTWSSNGWCAGSVSSCTGSRQASGPGVTCVNTNCFYKAHEE